MENLQLDWVLVTALAILVGAIAEPNQTLPGCNYTCGNVQVPYPFGIANSSIPHVGSCFLEPKFNLTCTNDSTLYSGSIEVQDISVLNHQLEAWTYVASYCTHIFSYLETDISFSVSSKENKFITVGCDSFGYLQSVYNGETYTTGCLTRCNGNTRKINDGTCSGIGCCQVDVPPAMRNITIYADVFPNSTEHWGNCSYSFVVKDGYYNFSKSDLKSLPYATVPLVLDWTVGDQNCKASKSGVDYVCRDNSYCDDTNTDYGYRCRCKHGFEGNPYIGCTDINECKTSNNTCISEKNCLNTMGSYKCFCPKGQSGNGTKDEPCHRKDVVTKSKEQFKNCFQHILNAGATAGIVVLLVGLTSLYLIYHKRKLTKLREKYFQQNGGSILLQQLSNKSSKITQIFTEEQLKKATNNFDESLIIGRGGYGTVFKGYLGDNRIVAVKKSKIVDKSQNEQFINEVIVLSQINHRNVVKLLGCCLETEVPLLVYEFVNNGTLLNFIQAERQVNNATWKTRLRIAAEAAGALAYLHSEASIPIIHRDVKTSNILLDDTYTSKVSDFGASRLVPLDQIELATMVQGTIGYLDPEYMQTSQLTEKSDVYSFGVVLVELLTGEKPFSFAKKEEERSLAMHFLSCLKEDRLFEVVQVGILNEGNKKEIMEVAILAAKCLRLIGEERPSMKEVAMELEGIRVIEKHPWIKRDQNLEETQNLLGETSSSLYEHGDSGSHQYTNGYDSIMDSVLIALDNGR
ncbi:putative wall-associated receptor kinase-like 16 [Abrus precatorius]|uniref:Wall-associated receptor kinase-like 16 n=1 Tax=Abrus precatorius TaxID=3816 RepID=A0A8B8MK77_ABRPR|nr:putative wall-associated receptor kinase-like 16 [Abrus precatorius]